MFRASCFLSAAVILIDRKIRVSLFCHEPTLRYQFSLEEKQFTRLNRPILVQIQKMRLEVVYYVLAIDHRKSELQAKQ